MLARKDPYVDEIKSIIYSSFPEAEISVVDNPRDSAGGVLYVTNVPEQFDEKLGRTFKFVAVAIHKKKGSMEYIVVPVTYEDSF